MGSKWARISKVDIDNEESADIEIFSRGYTDPLLYIVKMD